MMTEHNASSHRAMLRMNTAPSSLERQRRASYQEPSLPPIPASPSRSTTQLASSSPFPRITNLSSATLACPPTSLHPSILQCLEVTMADRPMTPHQATLSSTAEGNAHTSASLPQRRRYSTQRSVYSVYSSSGDTSDVASVGTTSAWASVSSLGHVATPRQRLNSTDATSSISEFQSGVRSTGLGATLKIPRMPASTFTASNHPGATPMPGARSEKSIRFWSRLRRLRQDKHSRSLSGDAINASSQANTHGGSGRLSLMKRRSSKALATNDASAPVKETNKVVKEYDPETGNKMLNQYMILGDLGRGVHGKVKLAQDTITGQACAIKIVDKSPRRRYRMSQYGRMSRSGFGNLSPSLAAANASNGVPTVNGVPTIGCGIVASDQPHLDKIRREIAILKKCRHPNVVRLIEVIDDPEARKIYLVLELLNGGEVRWKQPDADLPLLSQDETRRIFRDVVLGLEYLHYQGIVHRDIKPANLLMTADSRTVKISDFGVSHLRIPRTEASTNQTMSRRHSHRTSSSNDSQGSAEEEEDDRWVDDEAELAKTVGSPAFFAPELCYTGDFDDANTSSSDLLRSKSGGRPSCFMSGRPPVTKAIDVWALGVTLYCLVYGRCPFMAETEWELFNVIPRKELEFPDDVQVPDSLRDLLQRLLTKDPTKRITLSEVKRHPWVVADLPDPEHWRRTTDPARYTQVSVTDDEVKRAVTLKDRIRNSIRRISSTLSNLRRRNKTPPANNVVVAAGVLDNTTASTLSVGSH